MVNVIAKATKEKADEIRNSISDSDLVMFSHAVYDGTAKSVEFENIKEFIERVADDHRKSMPF